MNINIEAIKKKKSMQELLEFSLLNIDKPSDFTSFDVCQVVKKVLKLRKTSHFGTLDPKVTGVLPIALNRGCKLTGDFIGHDKLYEGTMHIHEDVSFHQRACVCGAFRLPVAAGNPEGVCSRQACA